MKKFIAWYRSLGVPQPLTELASKYRRQPSTSRLYVVRMGTAVSPEHAAQISKALDPIREKYAIDFLVLEPGIRLERFDDY